jgi:CBS domain containing-hemolysin-like protein
MTGWFPPLLGLLVLPVVGAALDATAETRRAGIRRSLSAAAHLSAVTCAAILAVVVGRLPERMGWDYSTIVLVGVAAAAWVEAVFLSGIRMHHRRARSPRPAGGDVGSEDAARPGGAGSPGSSGGLSVEGEALLLRVLALESVFVESIMTPRERVTAIDGTASPAAAVERMRACGHARLPVTVDGSIDRILGVVHAKDLVPIVVDGETVSPLRRHVRRCLRVPADQPVARLLADFRRDRVHFGIVTDPLGRTLGLVTIGDVFAQLAGTRALAPSATGAPGIPLAPRTGEGVSG